MQVKNIGHQSFGINSVKFIDEYSRIMFEKRTSLINSNKKAGIFANLLQYKPKNGSDVDVYIGIGKKTKSLELFAHGKKDILAMGAVEIKSKILSVNKISDAFKKLIHNVDQYRISTGKDTINESLNLSKEMSNISDIEIEKFRKDYHKDYLSVI